MKLELYDTRVPEGQYRVAFLGCEEGVAFGTSRWFGHFRIMDDGPYEGLPILRVWNQPRKGVLARSHNLSRDFMAITKKLPPSRGLKPSHFLEGCELIADVVTVKDQTNGRRRIRLPDDCHYSKIDGFVSISAGCPPCLRKAPNR
jgi:hypothetical protein